MTTVTRNGVTWVWLLLLLITGGSWIIATHLWGLQASGPVALVTVLVLTALKMQLVISQFMRVKHAPTAIRYLCAIWLVLLFTVLLWIYS